MINGTCGCGAVHYEVTTPFVEMHNCHCGRCRKTHGAAYATFAQTRVDGVRVTQGEEQIRDYASSPVVRRRFCGACGSNLFFVVSVMPERIWVAAGTLDADPGIRPGANAFVSSQAPWHALTDDLPQFPEYPPIDVELPAAPR